MPNPLLPDNSLAGLVPGEGPIEANGLSIESPSMNADRQRRSVLSALMDRITKGPYSQMPPPGASVMAGTGPGGKLPPTSKIKQLFSGARQALTPENEAAALKLAEEFGGLNREILQKKLNLYASDADMLINNLVQSKSLAPTGPQYGGLYPHVASAEKNMEGLANKLMSTIGLLKTGGIKSVSPKVEKIEKAVPFAKDTGATLQIPVKENLGMSLSKETGRARLLGENAQKIKDLSDTDRLSLILQKRLSNIPLTREDQLFEAAFAAKKASK